MPWAVCLVALGGAFGSAGRYLVAQLLAPVCVQFPWATFVVNVVGSFLIGFTSQFFSADTGYGKEINLFLAKGFCGGFTTFSTFSLENIELFETGHQLVAGLNIVASLCCCLAGVSVGIWCAKLIKH